MAAYSIVLLVWMKIECKILRFSFTVVCLDWGNCNVSMITTGLYDVSLADYSAPLFDVRVPSSVTAVVHDQEDSLRIGSIDMTDVIFLSF